MIPLKRIKDKPGQKLSNDDEFNYHCSVNQNSDDYKYHFVKNQTTPRRPLNQDDWNIEDFNDEEIELPKQISQSIQGRKNLTKENSCKTSFDKTDEEFGIKAPSPRDNYSLKQFMLKSSTEVLVDEVDQVQQTLTWAPPVARSTVPTKTISRRR